MSLTFAIFIVVVRGVEVEGGGVGGWGLSTSTQARPNMWEQESLAMLELSHYGNPPTALLWHYWGKKSIPSVIDVNVIAMIKIDF